MRVGVATIHRGREAHLARQQQGVRAQDYPVTRYVAVPMHGDPLPLAAARNEAIARLGDCDLAVLLDVDCVPAPGLVRAYAEAAPRDALLGGPVHYLAPGEAIPPREPADKRGAPASEPRHELFWSLSFAVRPEVHARIGGFDEGYAGYGAEDTDYAFAARAAGVPFAWAPGAWAYHQHHPVSSPPREHLDDIVPNARRFRAKWGAWPMEGWLRAFAEEGLVDWEPEGELLQTRSTSAAMESTVSEAR